MTITPDAPQTDIRMIDGIALTPKEVTTIGFEDLAPKATIEEERLHRKQRLAGALRIFGRFGFGEGVAGHITVRDPEFPDYFWVNPLGLSFRHMRVSDLILVNHHGEVVYGKHSVNRAAYVLHAAVHTARPDVIAAAHAHSVYGKAFSSLGIQLDPLTQDSCAFYENNVVIADHGGAHRLMKPCSGSSVLSVAHRRSLQQWLQAPRSTFHMSPPSTHARTRAMQ
jgi:hypothetical protein